MENATDSELVAKAKAGNEDAFRQLVVRYQKRIFYLAYRMTKDKDAADDLAQETFIRTYQALPRFKENYPFYTYIYRICMNLSINYHRRQKLTVYESRTENWEQILEQQGIFPESISTAEEKTLSRLEAEIDRLSPEYKAVVVLKFYENQSCEEIAKTLEIPLGTVLSRLARARQKLAQALAKKEAADEV
ncbi:MAG: sigma-70 family RNA polymerase sigma factor [candidate division Zixibacteria bacterium]|nr:sigma-70 family RNA polymerase sigma factor [candidate division Zixibacteria bacterium]